jgi:hypothetical protein
MSSGGGSSSDSGDAGSLSAEATNFEDYNTTSSYSGYDEAGISTPTSAYDSIGSTDSGGGNDYSGPTYDEAGVNSPTTTTTSDYRDDGPGYNPNASPTPTTASKDFYGAGDGRYDKDVMESGGSVYTNLGDNVQRRFDKQAELEGFAKAANIAGWVLNPVGKATTLGTTALADTIKANYLLGNIIIPFATWTSPAGDWFAKNTTQAKNTPQASAYTQDSGGGDSSSGLYIQQQAAAPTQTISGVQIESPAQKFYNQQQQTGQLSFQSDYDKARQQVNGLLGSPSSLGLLAVNESPFYGFLKSNNLNRRIL